MTAEGDRADAPFDENDISVNALKVLQRLTEHGYQAYLVGGSVRDLLLGKHPKDFDVATDAHPDEVRDLFRNSRSIGRRFKIVHVRYGRDIIEVATFRASHGGAEAADEASLSAEGMILRDNVYGSFEEDVERRDLTINGLYYEANSKTVVDLVGGLDDLAHRRIRLIGDPEARFREDPVRMLRAARFAAKLEFDMDPDSEQPLRRLGHLIQDVPPARLFDEVLKLFMGGYGERCFDVLEHLELFGWLFPDSRRVMETHPARELIRLALESTDRRIAADMSVTPAFIIAALLWYPFVEEKARLEAEGQNSAMASTDAASRVLGKQQLYTSVPKRFSSMVREIYTLQFRLPVRHGTRAETLFEHKRFRAAYDFLLLREQAGEQLDDLGAWWTRYQEVDEEERRIMVEAVPVTNPRRRRRKRKPRTRPKPQ